MATSKNNRESRGNDTLLSKRVFTGDTRPSFHSNFARWSNEAATEPRLAFDVTWDGPKSRENAFEGYGVLVTLSKDRLHGDLVLLIRPGMENLSLAYVDGESFTDACSKETIAGSAQVLGRVIGERQFLTSEQRLQLEKTYFRLEWGDNPSLLDGLNRQESLESSFNLALAEFQRLEDECNHLKLRKQPRVTVLWSMERALKKTQAFLKIRDKFRQDDPPQGLDDQEDADEALVDALILAYRAGQYQGPEPYMLDPDSEDFDGVYEILDVTLRKVAEESAKLQPDVEPQPFNAQYILSVLVESEGYQAARDEFRRMDVAEERWTGMVTEDMEEGDFDYGLRLFGAKMFRAGMIAERIIPLGTYAAQSDRA